MTPSDDGRYENTIIKKENIWFDLRFKLGQQNLDANEDQIFGQNCTDVLWLHLGKISDHYNN